MMDLITDFIHSRQIDSFQKLRLLLLLQRKPQLTGTTREFAEQLCLGDELLLKKIIQDLKVVGLVECTGDRCKLPDEPEIKMSLHRLAKAYEDPLSRQNILAHLKRIGSVGYDWDNRDYMYA